jgi:hypothetical protein
MNIMLDIGRCLGYTHHIENWFCFCYKVKGESSYSVEPLSCDRDYRLLIIGPTLWDPPPHARMHALMHTW